MSTLVSARSPSTPFFNGTSPPPPPPACAACKLETSSRRGGGFVTLGPILWPEDSSRSIYWTLTAPPPPPPPRLRLQTFNLLQAQLFAYLFLASPTSASVYTPLTWRRSSWAARNSTSTARRSMRVAVEFQLRIAQRLRHA